MTTTIISTARLARGILGDHGMGTSILNVEPRQLKAILRAHGLMMMRMVSTSRIVRDILGVPGMGITSSI